MYVCSEVNQAEEQQTKSPALETEGSTPNVDANDYEQKGGRESRQRFDATEQECGLSPQVPEFEPAGPLSRHW